MQLNDTSTKTGILQDCEQTIFGDEGYGRITGDTNLTFQFTNRANRALDRFAFLALKAGRWQADDTNYTTVSIATTNVVAGQSQYGFPSYLLEIEKVLVKDGNGKWHVLTAAALDDQDAGSFLENGTNQTGVPTRYFKRGESFFLDFTPNYASTGGLKVYFKRGPSYFVYTDTTKEPGIPSIFHPYISLHSSVNYAIDRNIAIAKNKYTQLELVEKDIDAFYESRQRDDKPRMKVLKQDNR